MTAQNESKTETAEHDLVITRVVDAPRELVYEVWTKPEHLDKWWGPAGMSLKVSKLDLKPGGMFLYSIATPDGQEMWGRFMYGEITPPEKIIFTSSFADSQGNIVRAPFSPVWPLEVFNELTFTEKGDQTLITLAGGPVNATAEERAVFIAGKESMNQGFAGTFAQLDAHLASLQQNKN